MALGSKKIHSLLFGQILINENISNIVLLLVRIYSGYTIMMAGFDKLPLPQWMTDQVIAMGFPFPEFFAWVASFSEFAFGALLVLGLITKLSGLMLAITMGFAAFGFQGVMPFTQMHIAQHFFWIFMLFTFLGAGKFSIDRLIYSPVNESVTKLSFVAAPAFMVLLAIGLFREFNPPEVIVDQRTIGIQSISVAGSFNEWDPAANQMQQNADSTYSLNVEFENHGLVEFKFTANNSWDINFGEEDQPTKGFPVSGIAEADGGGTTQNIRTYIPNPGTYQISFDSKSYEYSLDSLKIIQ